MAYICREVKQKAETRRQKGEGRKQKLETRKGRLRRPKGLSRPRKGCAKVDRRFPGRRMRMMAIRCGWIREQAYASPLSEVSKQQHPEVEAQRMVRIRDFHGDPCACLSLPVVRFQVFSEGRLAPARSLSHGHDERSLRVRRVQGERVHGLERDRFKANGVEANGDNDGNPSCA